MSVAQLERAATAPRRWIALSSSKDRNEDGALPSHTIRRLHGLQYQVYLVPGGRYLVEISGYDLVVWDLGYVSDGDLSLQQTKIWTTPVELVWIRIFFVHPTPDGMGFRILVHSGYRAIVYLFEIYPQEEIVQQKFAELPVPLLKDLNLDQFLYGNRVVLYSPEDKIVVVWDFVAKTMASWCIGLPDETTTDSKILRATETAIMIGTAMTSTIEILQIPPLVAINPRFGIEDELPEVAPVLIFKYFDDSTTSFPIPNRWYNDGLSSLPLYFDVLETRPQGGVNNRYKLNIASDFSNLSFMPIGDHVPITRPARTSYWHADASRICENSLVTLNLESHGFLGPYTLEADTWSLELHSDSIDLNQTPTKHFNRTPLVQLSPPFYSFCPASGRLVYEKDDGGFLICDFL